MSASNLIPAGIWVRVSTGGQDEANQLPDIERYCAARNYGIRKRYVVHGKSAYHGKQQKYLDQALADMRDGKIAVLVIWHSDRIERRPGKALLDVLAEFQAAGGRVESVQEPALGQLDFGGQVATFIAGLVNHEKSRHIAEQVKLAHDRIRENGALLNRYPWGFTSGGDKYARQMTGTPEGRKYVPEIFAKVAEGETLGAVARWLDEQGVPAPGGGRWWARTLGHMIRNPAYMGFCCERDGSGYGRLLHRCEALVPADAWKRAGDALDARPKKGPALPHRAMLTGVIFCARCEDSPMYRIISGKPGGRIAYYRCAGRGAQRKSCGNMVRLELADAAMCRIAETAFRWHKVTVTRLIPGSSHEAELAEVAFELRQLGADFAAERISDEKYEQRFAELVAERKRLKALPATPDKWTEIELDETYAGRWAALEPSGRGTWLKAQGFRVEAGRDALTLSQPGRPKQVTATVALGEKAAA